MHCSDSEFQMPVSQPGDIGAGSEACFSTTSSSVMRGHSLSRDRSVLVRSMFISAHRHCLLEWRQGRLPSCPLCNEAHVHPRVKRLHISGV